MVDTEDAYGLLFPINYQPLTINSLSS